MIARVRAVALTNYHEIARCVGLDPFGILAKSNLAQSALNDPEGWLPGQQVLNVLEHSAALSGREDFGLLLGEARTFSSLGPVSLLLKHEPTLGHILNSLIEYRRLVNELLAFRLHRDGPNAFLEWSLVPGLTSSQGVNLLATIAYRILVDGSGVRWQPECIHFRHSSRRHAATFRRVLRCQVEFDSERDGISFQTSSLAAINAYADTGLVAHARRLLRLLPGLRQETIVERARCTIAFLLQEGDASAANVARCLGLTVRTLQRRLESENESFRTLVDDVRREIAVRYLSSSNQPLVAVAQLTGFTSLSSFSRWFVAEFGVPPGRWRRKDSANQSSNAWR